MYKVPLLFWFDLFLEARAEILEKNCGVFWGIWRHQKDILKLSDLYAILSTFHSTFQRPDHAHLSLHNCTPRKNFLGYP